MKIKKYYFLSLFSCGYRCMCIRVLHGHIYGCSWQPIQEMKCFVPTRGRLYPSTGAYAEHWCYCMCLWFIENARKYGCNNNNNKTNQQREKNRKRKIENEGQTFMRSN